MIIFFQLMNKKKKFINFIQMTSRKFKFNYLIIALSWILFDEILCWNWLIQWIVDIVAIVENSGNFFFRCRWQNLFELFQLKTRKWIQKKKTSSRWTRVINENSLPNSLNWWNSLLNYFFFLWLKWVFVYKKTWRETKLFIALIQLHNFRIFLNFLNFLIFFWFGCNSIEIINLNWSWMIFIIGCHKLIAFNIV